MISEEQIRKETALEVARLMMIAARTAPKGRGRDTLVIALASDEDRQKIASHMDEIARRDEIPFFSRDAENLRKSDALILLGTKVAPLGLNHCGYCGYESCAEKAKHPEVPCAFNLTDLGIALGSAVSVAASHRIDNRIMYSAGRTALEMGLCGEGVAVLFAVPLSISPKSPYFDR